LDQINQQGTIEIFIIRHIGLAVSGSIHSFFSAAKGTGEFC
jgi:hypothetical protein